VQGDGRREIGGRGASEGPGRGGGREGGADQRGREGIAAGARVEDLLAGNVDQ